MSSVKKCKVDKNKISPCIALSKAFEDSSAKKGLSVLSIVNLNTGKNRNNDVILKSGEFSKRGIVLNYCPFCGERILSPQTMEANGLKK